MKALLKRQTSIRTKLLLLFSGLTLLVLCIQFGFNIYLSRPYFLNYKKNEAFSLYHRLEGNFTTEPEELASLMQGHEDKNGFAVLIFADQELIYNNRNAQFYQPFDDKRPMDKHREKNDPFHDQKDRIDLPENFLGGNLNPKIEILNEFKSDRELLTLKGQFPFEQQQISVLIQSPIESIHNSVTVLGKINIAVSSLVLMIGVVLSLYLSRKISAPINRIATVATHVADLDFSIEADLGSDIYELNQLSECINSMSHRLNQLIGDLTLANAKLQQDIDYQKRLDISRRDFISNVSHELKTPLHLLMMYTEGLKMNLEGVDKNYYCDTILEEVQSMNRMVAELLELSAMEKALYSAEKELVSLSNLVESTVNKYQPMLKDFDFTAQIQDDIYILGNENYLEQAIRNYLINAINHTQKGDMILLSLTKAPSPSDDCVFKVYNQGNPIKEEEQSRIWESFYKSDQSRVRANGSSHGLGLYIVKSIIESLNGKYGVKNQDQGVIFTFTLPTLPSKQSD